MCAYFTDHGWYIQWEATGLYERNLCTGRLALLTVKILKKCTCTVLQGHESKKTRVCETEI